jgi:hypothetical protein
MFKIVLSFFMVLALFVSIPVGHTATYTLTDDPATSPLVPPTYTHLFDFSSLITNPLEVIDSATLYIDVFDDGDTRSDLITLAADGTVILNNFNLTRQGSDTLGPFDVFTYVTDNKQMNLSIQSDANSDFYYDRSTISVITHVVPLPATGLLLGTGFLGLGLWRWRQKRS